VIVLVVIWQTKEIKVVDRVVINVVVKDVVVIMREMDGKNIYMEIMYVMNVVLQGGVYTQIIQLQKK
jgi:hypothetical protein